VSVNTEEKSNIRPLKVKLPKSSDYVYYNLFLLSAVIVRVFYNTNWNHMTVHKNAQRKQLNGNTVMPERHACTQKCACISAEFSTRHRNDLDYNASAWMKQDLKQSGVGELRLCCKIIDSFHSWWNSSSFKTELISLWISECTVGPSACCSRRT